MLASLKVNVIKCYTLCMIFEELINAPIHSQVTCDNNQAILSLTVQLKYMNEERNDSRIYRIVFKECKRTRKLTEYGFTAIF